MSRDAFSISLKAKLETLFSTYAQTLQLREQRDIVKKGFVFSKVDPSANILVMGMNPSLRNDFVSQNGYSYDYKRLSSDRYFKKFVHLLKDFEPLGITYCDLFYQRHTEQKQIDHFLKDNLGRTFLREQLALTREVIQYISPKLILLFNRKGADFFTVDWIGLSPKPYHSWQRTNTTPLVYTIENTECLIYFSSFLGYRTKKSTYQKLRDDLPKLLALAEHKIL